MFISSRRFFVTLFSKNKTYLLRCVGKYVKIYLGAAVAIGGGFAFQCMSTYRLPRILGGDAYEESTRKG